MNLIQSWAVKKYLEKEYERLIKRYSKEISNQIKDKTTIDEILSTLNNLTFDREVITKYVSEYFGKMLKSNSRSWTQTLKTSNLIYTTLEKEIATTNLGVTMNNIIQNNVSMISNLPKTTQKHLNDYITEQTLSGKRASNMVEEIKKRAGNISDNSAKLIARTQVSMTQSALTEARSTGLGLKAYVWETSEDERVRKSHDHMQDVIIPWGMKPDPEALIGLKSYGHYHAGNTFNCRCYSSPIVNIDRLSFPVKVYTGNSIVTMNKKEFEIWYENI